MADTTTYKVKFELPEGLETLDKSNKPKDTETIRQMNDTAVKETDSIVNNKDQTAKRAKIVAQAATAIGIATTVSNMGISYQNTNYQISGDYIAAERMTSVQSQVNELLGVGTTVGIGFAIGGIPGGIAAVAYQGIQLATRAINHSNEVRKYVAQIEVDMKEKAYIQQRLVTNIAEIR